MKRSNPLWKFFCSVKLTIVLLLSLAATSIIGTLIPQNQSPEAYLRAFGSFRYQLLSVLGLTDMYHAWWFQGLLLLLTVNIVVCSIDRLQGSWKLIFNRQPKIQPERYTRRADACQHTDKRDVDALVGVYEPIIKKRFSYCRVERSDGKAIVYGEKGRLSRLGVYIVHLSVIFLLVGGIVGSFFGFEGFVNIPEGEATDTIRIRNTGALHRLDFQIRCDDFSLTLYDSGAPKEYRSALTIVKDGKEVLSKDIIVNDPLRYGGINIFQSSYGKLPPGQMPRPKSENVGPSGEYTLSFTSKSSGMQYTRKAKVGEPVAVPEGLGQFVIMSFEADAAFRGMAVGAALKGIFTPKNGDAVEVLLPLKFANFDKMRGGDVVIAVADQPQEHFSAAKPMEERYYTGLQVTRDPGVVLVYSGFALMIIGCFVTFYMSHQTICIVIEGKQKNSRVTVAGIANRNKLGMKNVVDNLYKHMGAA